MSVGDPPSEMVLARTAEQDVGPAIAREDVASAQGVVAFLVVQHVVLAGAVDPVVVPGTDLAWRAHRNTIEQRERARRET